MKLRLIKSLPKCELDFNTKYQRTLVFNFHFRWTEYTMEDICLSLKKEFTKRIHDLRYLNLEPEEIAHTLGCSRQTVYNALKTYKEGSW